MVLHLSACVLAPVSLAESTGHGPIIGASLLLTGRCRADKLSVFRVVTLATGRSMRFKERSR